MQSPIKINTLEDDPKVLVGIRLTRSIDRAVEIACATADCTKGQFFEDALREKLDRAEDAA